MGLDVNVNVGNKMIESREYWNSLNIPKADIGIINHDFFSEGKYTKQEIKFPLQPEFIDKLHELTNQNDLPLYMVFLTGLQIQLFKYTGKEETIVGIPAYVGDVKDNTAIKSKVLPLINTIMKEMTVKKLLKAVQENIFKAYENQYCDINHLLKSSNGGSGVMDYTPISISMNTLHSKEFIDYINSSTNNHLSICINKHDSQSYDLSIIYNAELYDGGTVTLFAERLIRLVKEIMSDLDQKIKQIDIITENERFELLELYNRTCVYYPNQETVQALFESQVEKTPNNIAVKYGDTELTYKDLNEKANQLARLLVNKGVSTDSIVAIMVSASIEMVIAILGVLKAGGAYLPIDINQPSNRKKYMLQDAEVKILISGKNFMDDDLQFNGNVIDIFREDILKGATTNLELKRSSSDLAYVIYTSGTTGNPKGVMIEHKSLINYIHYSKDRYLDEGKGDFPLYTSISFDLTVTSIYVPLLSGNKICVYSNENQYSFTHIVEDPIDVMKLTPAHLSVINSLDLNDMQISRFIVGGEELSCQLADEIHQKFNGNVEIINEYGPTEATVGCIVYAYQKGNKREKSLSIGTPINNSRVYILDEELNLVPKGVPGDLWIAGDGLARGYLNKPELTSEKFIIAPFNPKERMYKTGDIARWKLDGTIEFFGRKDNQVKIRGFRIELGEVENSLLSHKGVKEAVVLARENDNYEKYLVAYITGKDQVNISELRDYLKNFLPSYMVPSYIMQLDVMPLTTNGKIDRSVLPKPSMGSSFDYSPPRNDIERQLVKAWTEVLGVEKLGINDNFFDLGGDSIKAIRITSKLQNYGYKLEVKDLFNFGSIKELSGKVVPYTNVISQEEVTGEAPLIPIQRLFFENDLTNMHHWNQSVMIYNKDGFQENVIKHVLNELIKHHDALRMVYQKNKGTITQVYRKSNTKLLDLQVKDYQSCENYKDKIKKCSEEIQSSIDLENGPLVKAGLFRTSEGDYLLIAIHHLVIDGVSWRILFEDFADSYNKVLNGEEIVLQGKTNSFKDWGLYLQKLAKSEDFQNEIFYWKKIEENYKPLKADYQYGEYRSKQKYVQSIEIELSKKDTEELLKNTNKAYNTEINDILLTALGLTIQDWTSEEQFLVNLEGHGREQLEGDIDVSRTIGWFTTHFPLLLNLKKEKQLGYSIKQMKDTIRRIPNKGIGYGILGYLGEESPLKKIKPQINFNYLGQFDEKVNYEGLELSTLTKGNSISPESESLFDIDINGTISDHKLGFTFAFSNQKYSHITIERLATRYKEHLLSIIEHCQNQETPELSPSDYSSNDLTLDELEELKDEYKAFTIKDIYPLTPMQEGMLFHSLMDPDSQSYFEQKSFTLKGDLNLEVLERSFSKLIERYDVLRTIIVHENMKSPKQMILKTRETSIYYESIMQLSDGDKSEYINNFLDNDRKRGFKLNKDILLRLSVIKINHEEYKVIWSSHHILMDGWCSGIIMKDFFMLYSSEKNNYPITLKKPAPFVHYIDWLQKQPKQAAKKYWEQYLEGYANHAKIPEDIRKKSAHFKKEKLEFQIDRKSTEALFRVSKEAQVTINTIVQTVWGILLQKYTGLNDVVFGSVVSGRNAAVDGIEEMIGLFINTIPIRVRENISTNFVELAKGIQKDSLESTMYDYYPLAEIQSLSEAKQKLINHILVFQNYYIDDEMTETKRLLDVEITDIDLFEQNNYDLGVMIIPNDELTVRFSYNSNVYDSNNMHSLKARFIKIMETISNNPDILVSEMDITTGEERHQLVEEFNATQSDYEREKTLQELFEEQANKNPEQIAVQFRNTMLTYRELNEKSNQLAGVLRQKGVKRHSIVGLMIRSSPEMMIGILGILKSGAAYLPMDPTHPSERVQYMMKDAGIEMLVTDTDYSQKYLFNGTIVDLSDTSIFTGDQTNVEIVNQSGDSAYVIYTSGTTGQAKGVMVSHSSLVNYSQAMIKKASITSKDETALLSSYAFDLGYTTVYTALISGITLHILSEDMYRDPEQLVEYTTSCTYLKMTPSLFSILIHSGKMEKILEEGKLRMIILGGEPVNQNDLKQFRSLDHKRIIRILNHYGPTESTIGCVTGDIDLDRVEDFSNVIGRPLDNMKTYVLDYNQQLTPIGVPGELYVSGEGLAIGYVNKPELTAEKFSLNPFDPGKRMYRTGDLVKRLSDGRIEFIGRIDNQVKVRGYRVELGEIENILLTHPDIKEAVVIDRENEKGETYLAAYITGKSKLYIADISSYVKEYLPHYMVPTFFVEMEMMPLTKNGKIDKKELPLPNNRDMVTIEYVAPENDIQRNLVDIWSDILGIEKIGIDDNFFDLGGDSIKAIRITSRLLKFGYKLEIKHLFKYGNIKEISKRVTSNVNKISQKEVTGEAPLIPIQKMFFESNFTNQQHWNQSVMIFNEDGFHENAIKRVLTELIKHHDALRMIYKTNANSITQIIRSSEMKLYDMYVKDFRTSHNVNDLIKACCNELQSSIDLEAGPLVKVGLFKTKEGDHLLLAIHHLVIDGVSWRILLEDFAEGYNQEIRSEKITFQQKTHSFKDWGNYLEGQVKSNSLKGEIEYWSQLEKINIKDLPVDKESESLNKWYDFKDIQVSFSKKETDNLLKSTNRAYNTEINDLLLTALGLAFNQGMEIDKFFVTLEGHGREIIGRDIDISRTVGWFTTHYPVVIDTNQYQLNHSIKNVKETLRKVPNKGIGYGILKYMESGEKWQGVNPKVKFNYLGQFDESINNHLFEISKLSTGDSISLDSERLYEIDISGIVSNHELSINFSYNSEKYHEHTMNNLASAFKHQLLSIIDHCMSLQRPETTPSDYTDSAMTFDELEVIKNKYEIQKKNKIEDIYPLTPMQNGMLFHSLLDRESVTYFEQKSFTTMGEMDVELLEKSFFKVIERYEILRTMIAYENMKTAKQVILGEYKEKVRYEDISILKEEEKSLYLEGFLDKDRKEGFNLSENFLVRLSVLKLNNKEHKVIWSSHHILMDGWCSSLIMNDLFTIYSSLKNQKTVELKEPAPYVEYVKWLEEQSENNAKEYWANYVKGYSNHPQLPIKTGDHSQVFKKDRIDFTIDKQMTNSLNNISKIAQVTINTVIQSIWGLLIQKYTGMEDIIFGSVVSGRNAKVEAIEEMVGLFINTIPVRVQTTSKDLRFVDLIKDVQQASLESSKFDYYPLAEIQSLSEVKHNLVNHIMMFQNFHVNESLDYSTEELDFSIEDINVHEQTNYDFDVMVIPRDELTVMFSYNESLYNREFVIQLKEHFLKMLRTIIKNHEVKISELSIITEPEKAYFIETLNHTSADYPREKTLHQLFEEQVERTPNHIALVMKGELLTYKELNERANQVARMLRQKGVLQETIVALMTDRSSEMIIGLIGILKAGGAYLPIDPTHPVDRIGAILSDAKVNLLLTYGDMPSNLPYTGQVLDLGNPRFSQEDKTNLGMDTTSRQLAYVIYTSGSTGTPKGVMVEHQQVNNFIHGMVSETELEHYESILCLTTLSFDIFGLETLAPLTKGLTVVVSSEEESQEGERLAVLLETNGVEVIQSTPTRLKMLMESNRFRMAMKNLKALFVGGEELPQILWEELKEYGCHVFNMYGPTETTIWSTAKRMEKTDSITIGKPIQNTQVYVLDHHQQLVPEGVLGELCIGGDGVARGYFNREELTQEKFIPNPFVPGKRMYKTGDLARWLPNGELEYKGRIDHQVKIRGFRIELGEIETQLLSYSQVKEAVVAAKEDDQGQKFLCAYIVSHETLDKAKLKAYLKRSLPDYMIPTYMMEIDAIPLTNNGKVNRTALPEPNIQGLIAGEFEAPQTSLQVTLASIWREVLGVERIGLHDNFFDLGGHSLKATVLMSEIHRLLGKEVPLKEIFTSPTIHELSSYMENSTINIYETIETCEEKPYYETSSAQKRMYSVQQLDRNSTAYNMPGVFELEGEVDLNWMESVFQQLIMRHESLRTSFETVDGEIVQRIRPSEEFQLISRNLSEKGITEATQAFIRPFVLEQAPLFRVELVILSGKQYLMMDMHHIISDGFSMSLLLKEFTQLYNGEQLEPLRIQYKDFAQWQNEYFRSGNLEKEATYWKEQFKETVPVLQLPYDYERPAIQSFEGDSVHFTLGTETAEGLRKLAREEGATLHMVLLSAFNVLLSKYSGQEDIVVGVPVAGRPHADLRNIMGMFVNTLVMRNQPVKDKTFTAFLREVKENSLQAYDHQNYQLEELLDNISFKRDVSRNPLFDVIFNLNNIEYEADLKLSGMEIKHLNLESDLSRVDLSLTGFENNSEIYLKLVYSTNLFKQETIKRAMEDLITILTKVAEDSEIVLNEIHLFNADEEDYILKEKNEMNDLRNAEFSF